MSNAAKQTLSLGVVALLISSLLGGVIASALYVGNVAVSIDHRLTVIETNMGHFGQKLDDHIALTLPRK